jgi:Dolichyl-phosphate-mannose-protein mannosyltransferase
MPSRTCSSESKSSLWMMALSIRPQGQPATLGAAMERSATSEFRQTGDESRVAKGPRLTGYLKCLFILFLFTLPLANPWVRGDGVGYYAYVRALLIEKQLDFQKDWEHGNESFTLGRLDSAGQPLPNQYASTGRIANLWSIGPSLLWSPFVAMTHFGVVAADHFGAHIPADGFSAPYRIAMALATSLYGFLGLWLSFLLAREYFAEKWAFLATIGIWGASSLPVYMYFNPSWSHAHSAFAVALFVWYWHRTRGRRSLTQWVFLGLISGLMVDVYYPNGIFLLIPLIEAISEYAKVWNSFDDPSARITRLFSSHLIYAATFVFGLLPTLISRRIIFGSITRTGYMPARTWIWNSPALWSVLWSSDHGLLSWTPILILALFGLLLFRRTDRSFASKLIVCTVAFYLLIAFYPDWDGLSSFGSRFFISLTPLFVLGLAAFFEWLTHTWNERRARIVAATSTVFFVLWNLGMMYQWGTHLIPPRGPISWRGVVYNQFAVVPGQAAQTFEKYLLRRSQLMQHIEDEDTQQLKSQPSH